MRKCGTLLRHCFFWQDPHLHHESMLVGSLAGVSTACAAILVRSATTEPVVVLLCILAPRDTGLDRLAQSYHRDLMSARSQSLL